MDFFHLPEAYLLAMAALLLVRTLLLRLCEVATLALILRGSLPEERQILISEFSRCLRPTRAAASRDVPSRRR